MVEFLFLFVMLISCIIGILIGSVNKVKGPKGTLVKDEMTANWLKEIDGPEEPMTDIDYDRVLRSYNVSLSNKPIYAVFFFAIAVTVYLVGWAVGFEMIHKMIGVIFIVASVATLFILLQKNRSVFDVELEAQANAQKGVFYNICNLLNVSVVLQVENEILEIKEAVVFYTLI